MATRGRSLVAFSYKSRLTVKPITTRDRLLLIPQLIFGSPKDFQQDISPPHQHKDNFLINSQLTTSSQEALPPTIQLSKTIKAVFIYRKGYADKSISNIEI
jgi:hypothetical protein